MSASVSRPEVPIIVGIIGALVLVWIARRLAQRELLVYGVGLGFTGAAYLLAGLLGGAPAAHLVREAVGALIYGAFAVFGVRRWPLLLAVGWTAHVAWDLFFHHINGPEFAPGWYAMFCVGFDLPLGGYIAGLAAPRTIGYRGGSQ